MGELKRIVKILVKKMISLITFRKDKKSEVEFYLIDAFEILHFFPIYQALINAGIKTRIVAEPCEINVSHEWFDYKNAIDILKELDIKYVTRCNSNALFAFTTQDSEILDKYCNGTKKINLHYGVTLQKKGFLHSERMSKGFDYSLVHGEYQKMLYESMGYRKTVRIIGYPKYRDFILEKNDIDLTKMRLGIYTDKPILTYFPTWDDDCGILQYGDLINELRREYYVVIKPHHCLDRLPECAIKKEKAITVSDLYLSGNESFENSVIVSDVILCDSKSGSCLEAALINPDANILLLNVKKDLQEYDQDLTRMFVVITDTDEFGEIVKKSIDDPCKSYRKNNIKYYYDMEGSGLKDFITEIGGIIAKS